MRRAVINTGILAAATGLAGGCDDKQQRCNREPEAPDCIPDSETVATVTRPIFWRDDDRPTLDRRITVSWTCCPAGPTRVEEDTHDR